MVCVISEEKRARVAGSIVRTSLSFIFSHSELACAYCCLRQYISIHISDIRGMLGSREVTANRREYFRDSSATMLVNYEFVEMRNSCEAPLKYLSLDSRWKVDVNFLDTRYTAYECIGLLDVELFSITLLNSTACNNINFLRVFLFLRY